MLHAFNGFNENNAVRLVTSEKGVGLSPPPPANTGRLGQEAKASTWMVPPPLFPPVSKPLLVPPKILRK